MEWLNYHHLYYFWVVAREGSIARAQERLLLSQPTISAQIRALERALGEKLFTRAGRGLALTATGRVVARYGDDIFSLGRELLNTVKGRPTREPARLLAGVADVVPKLISFRLLEVALRLAEPVHLVCHEDRPARLLGELASHELDIVISDAPVGAGSPIRAYSHPLGECGVTLFAAPARAAGLRRGFPGALDGAPFLLPMHGAALRRSLDAWFEHQDIHPRVVGEFEDSALLSMFGQAGHGIFAAPSVIESDVRRRYGVVPIGRPTGVVERFYVLSAERKIRHPAVIAITAAAERGIFPPETGRTRRP